MKHWIVHLLGWNVGRVVTKYDDDGCLWVGFKCTSCGHVSGSHKTKTVKSVNPITNGE
jgi:hypothetical protein